MVYVCEATLRSSNAVRAVAITEDGRVVSADHSHLYVWDRKAGRVNTLDNHGHGYDISFIISLPGGRIVSGGDYVLKLWDLESGHCLTTMAGHTTTVEGVAALPGGQVVSCANGGRTNEMLKVWEVSTGLCVKNLTGHEYSVTSVDVFPDGRLLTGSSDATVKIWNVADGLVVRSMSHSEGVNYVRVLPDGRVVCAGYDCIRISDADTGRCLLTFPSAFAEGRRIFSMTSLADGRFVTITGMHEQKMRVLDATGHHLQDLPGHRTDNHEWITCVDQLPDGRLVTGSEDKTLKIWAEPEREIEKGLAKSVARQRACCDVEKIIAKFL